MIKAAITLGATKAVVFGLSKQNCDRLLAGQPIHIKQAQQFSRTNEPFDVVIMGGVTDQDMFDELAKVVGGPQNMPKAQVISSTGDMVKDAVAALQILSASQLEKVMATFGATITKKGQ